ncbi:putative Sorting nexin-14-like protein, partial [Naja naja]
MRWARAAVERLCQRARRVDVLRETCRQYPLFCCILLGFSVATLLLSR